MPADPTDRSLSSCGYPGKGRIWKNSRANKTYLILDQELDTLDGSSCGLGDGGGDTTHCYRRSASTPCEIRCRKPHPSPPDESDGNNDRSTLAKVDILKKSITKGGLLKHRSAWGSWRWDSGLAKIWSQCHWATMKLTTQWQSMRSMFMPLIEANWASLRLNGDDQDSLMKLGRNHKSKGSNRDMYVHAHDGLLLRRFVAHVCDGWSWDQGLRGDIE
jgi:hypothetical protein